MKAKASIHPFLLSVIILILSVNFSYCYAQSPYYNELKKLVQSFKTDPRGPFQAIRWFCPDGSILPPTQRCPQPGGIQHALHKDVVQEIAQQQGIYFGQILAGTAYADFFDHANQNSRLNQYQLEKYLQSVDDGWILRRARYYRGAFQAEDEESWGLKFLTWLVSQDDILRSQYFLVRQSFRDIPHQANDHRLNNIRGLAKTIADSLPAFNDLRIKIHGQPDNQDAQRVRSFRLSNQQKISPGLQQKLLTLEKDIESVYQSTNLVMLKKYLKQLSPTSPIYDELNAIINTYTASNKAIKDPQAMLKAALKDISKLMLNIRQNILLISKPAERVSFIDLSIDLEDILFRNINNWRAQTFGELFEKSYSICQAAAGAGLMELWEWKKIEPVLKPESGTNKINLLTLLEKIDQTQRAVEWCTGMVRANYEPVVNIYYNFEPLVTGFFDDRIRSSILLQFGELVGRLKENLIKFTGSSNYVMGIKNQNHINGLNPGFAFGELEVIDSPIEQLNTSANKIYIMQRPPMDLKPVAGIATVTEGNIVSHVQLLCKNLGIPNSVLTMQNLKDLIPFSGKKVFYAVSPQGTVVMKPENEMTNEEIELIQQRSRREERIAIPVDKIDLSRIELINLRSLRPKDSGKICGPKAANLALLKQLFPDNVVEGIVIPFGIFRRHFDQQIPEKGMTYWKFLQNIFQIAEADRNRGISNEQVDKQLLSRLAELREVVSKMEFLPDFSQSLKDKFIKIFGARMGQIAVFIRSDTNMEDLKDFTGAGLNLTVFNAVEADKIFQAIRDVWASPFTERSYRWRQKFLLNPENVFPSILIIPTVNVDKSGVLITAGLVSSDPKDVTIAFNRGAGGAVEGQIAETYLLKKNGENRLLFPSRESTFIKLPTTGGTKKATTFFQQPILDEKELTQLRAFADELITKLSSTKGGKKEGPFDVELGSKDKTIWLFQVRPYVENKRARSSAYLQTLDPKFDKNIIIELNEILEK